MRADLNVSMERCGIEFDSLTQFQRIILTADAGTVTDILEAHARERMLVTVLAQDMVSITSLGSQERRDLDLGSGEGRALVREIVVRGEASGTCHLYARSVVALERLPERVLDGLLAKKKAIGHLLHEHRVFRLTDLLAWAREPARDHAELFEIPDNATLLSRRYVVSVAEGPIMLITEKIVESER